MTPVSPTPLRGLSASAAGRPGSLHSGRQRASLLLGAAAAGAFAPLFALAAPSSSWTPVPLTLALAAIALFSYLGGVAVRRSALLDGGFVAALVALAVLGPLPAAWIWIGTELAALAFERVRPEAFLANVASYGWAVLAAALVLDGLGEGRVGPGSGPAAYGALAIAGAVMLSVNFLVTRTAIAVVRDGERFGAVVRGELVAHAPVTIAMVVLGTATVFAYSLLGMLALGLFAAIVVVPQIVLPALLRPRPVYELEHTDAVRLYAGAIAGVLGLERPARLVLKDAAAYMRERRLRPRTGTLSNLSDGHRLALVEAVLYHREHWDGEGGVPGSVGGEMIPLTSRILAVSDAWAGLTAKESPRLSHAQALNQLEARAGMHFDPAVVAAAAQVVAEERLGSLGEVAYQPRLHRIPLEGIARRVGAQAV